MPSPLALLAISDLSVYIRFLPLSSVSYHILTRAAFERKLKEKGHIVDQDVMKVAEVARRLGVNIKTVYRMLELGQLRGVRAGRLWLVPTSAFQDYLEGRDGEGSE